MRQRAPRTVLGARYAVREGSLAAERVPLGLRPPQPPPAAWPTCPHHVESRPPAAGPAHAGADHSALDQPLHVHGRAPDTKVGKGEKLNARCRVMPFANVRRVMESS